MTDPNSLQRAIYEFYRMLDFMRFQLAELSQLKVLISKHPDHARQMLDGHERPRTGNGS